MEDRFAHKRSIKALLDSKDDDSGHIEAKVFMIWPPRQKLHRVNLEVVEDSDIYRFEVEILYNEGIAFRPHERVSLALKGMKVARRQESSAPYGFPIVLRFPDGVVLKYLTGANAGKVVDTWQENTDEWYNPGKVRTVSDAVTNDASVTQHSPVPTPPRRDLSIYHVERVKGDQPPSVPVVVADDTATVHPTRPVQRPGAEKRGRPSRNRPRKKQKLNKQKGSSLPDELADDTDRLPRNDMPPPRHEQPQSSAQGALITASDGRSNPHSASSTHVNGEVSVRQGSESNLPDNDQQASSGTASVPAPQLKAGVRTQRGDLFTAIDELQKGPSMINVIGIVISVNPGRKTMTGEWSRSFTLVDPSTVDSPRQSISVNCFQKKYLEWLPQVRKDDVVILRKLKIVEFNGVVTATGYGDKLRWAVYDPVQHSIRPPDKGSAPEKEAIDDGMGYEYSPYWDPIQDSTELEYCRQIGEWWKAKQGLEGQSISVVQCSRVPKQHLLISDASPDLPPTGFFNCTVEVLQKFNGQGAAATIYVTDYTANALVHPVQATWCPPELSDRVLQINMWDNARSITNMMHPGEYWYLHNVRARWNPSHYMEGTMQLAGKVTQLDETKPDGLPHLRALLARKNEFKNKSGPTSEATSLRIFPEMLLQDVDINTSFLTCIVELLHKDFNSRDGHFIYVTDFTYNPDLPTIVSTTGWARGLEHRVLKIKLDDAQANPSSDLKPGSILTIRNLRIKRSNASGGMHGCLGGQDTLIIPLVDSSSPHTKTFQRNKEGWKRESMLDSPTTLPNGSHREEAHGLLQQSSTASDDTISLDEILLRQAPDTFKVRARAVDYFPFSLEDACVLRCTKCDTSPPPSCKGCPRCDDMMETHCRWYYCLFIQLQNEKGSELIVSLSGKECTLLQDINPADFRCDRAAFRRFLERLDPILGNLRDVHVAWSNNEHKVIESPSMIFTVESWNIGDEKGYTLLSCTTPQGNGL